MRSPIPVRAALAGAAALTVATAPALAGGPPNDDCSNPEILVGTGSFAFDTTGATTGMEGQNTCLDPVGPVTIANDIWYCWTAPCDGIVTIETCAMTELDTRIALWAGCDCPTQGIAPLCCADDECGFQSILTCDVVCGQEYLIQIGDRDPASGGGTGGFRILCEGDPCDDPPPNGDCEMIAGQCCFGRPAFTADEFQAFGSGPVGVMTASPGVFGNQVLTVYDYSDFSAAVPGTNFPIARYSAPNWTGGELGSIFGVTLDPAGNIYVTPTIVYTIDSVGIGSAGDVYRVDAVTGAVSVFTTAALPNTGVGLGNIVHDCEHDQFFVTNFEDGLIYRLDAGGNVLSTFDHGAPDDGTPGIAPLGDRPWGVTVHGGRVYYGIWAEDQGRPSGTAANEVWSVALAAGDFSGAATLEVSLPTMPGAVWSNPPADLRFGPDGRMYVAERSMGGDSTPGAHDSRLLEYVCTDGTWAPGGDYLVGVVGGDASSAGGVDVDYRDGERIWVTADAIQFMPDTIYGAQGLPDGGGDPSTSVLVDYQGNLGLQDKTGIGDIAISCPTPCGEGIVKEIECLVGPDGFTNQYAATLTITNTSGVDVHYLLFPGDVVDDNVVELDPPLADGDSVQVGVVLSNLEPGMIHCIDLVMADENVDECCTLEICFETPECDCLIFEAKDVTCDAAGQVQVSISFVHLAPYTAEHAFLIVESPTGATVTPDYVDLPSIPQFGGGVIGPLTVTGVGPDDEVCIRVTTHAEDLIECCSEVTCFPAPDCVQGFDACDLDQDGVVAFSDLIVLLSSWGPCPGQPCPADLDGSGAVDFPDLIALLASWSQT